MSKEDKCVGTDGAKTKRVAVQCKPAMSNKSVLAAPSTQDSSMMTDAINFEDLLTEEQKAARENYLRSGI